MFEQCSETSVFSKYKQINNPLGQLDRNRTTLAPWVCSASYINISGSDAQILQATILPSLLHPRKPRAGKGRVSEDVTPRAYTFDIII